MKKIGIFVAILTTLMPLRCVGNWSGGYSIELLVNGRPAQEYYHRGTCYVEAFRGQEYSIRIHNPTSYRVAVTLSVDGLNTIDAKRTAARQGAKWVIDPHDTVTIDGWQTSGATARRFYFTTEDRSYAQWIGDTRNVGIISAAFFRERQRPIVLYDRQDSKPRSASPAPPSGSKDSARKGEALASPESGAREAPQPSDEYAATGIGREVDNSVNRVWLDLEDAPAATINVRYEYRPELVRLGILPSPPIYDPLDRREHASGFEDGGFAPDPYRH